VQASISNLLQSFNSFSLAELEAANLLERKDFKYTFAIKHLPAILQQLQPHYSILKINDYLYTDYITDYYDTDDFQFYMQHHNGKSNRYKVRLREYVQSKVCYYEVKYKNNKNWTSKQRQKISSLDVPIDQYTKAITEMPLCKKLKVQYCRITLLSNNNSEKLTFDINLSYSKEGSAVDYNQLCIAEVKSKTHHPYVFRQLIKELGYRTQGLSKYCFGIASLYHELKNNNFKKSFLYLRKISN
jgi:VTC domain